MTPAQVLLTGALWWLKAFTVIAGCVLVFGLGVVAFEKLPQKVQDALAIAWSVGLTVAGALAVCFACGTILAGCAVPTGVRPSALTVYGEAGNGRDGYGTARDTRGGASLEFEFTYPEPAEDE